MARKNIAKPFRATHTREISFRKGLMTKGKKTKSYSLMQLKRDVPGLTQAFKFGAHVFATSLKELRHG